MSRSSLMCLFIDFSTSNLNLLYNCLMFLLTLERKTQKKKLLKYPEEILPYTSAPSCFGGHFAVCSLQINISKI